MATEHPGIPDDLATEDTTSSTTLEDTTESSVSDVTASKLAAEETTSSTALDETPSVPESVASQAPERRSWYSSLNEDWLATGFGLVLVILVVVGLLHSIP